MEPRLVEVRVGEEGQRGGQGRFPGGVAFKLGPEK